MSIAADLCDLLSVKPLHILLSNADYIGDWGLGSLGGSTAYFIATGWWLPEEDVILFYVSQVTIQASASQASPAGPCK